MFSCTVDGENYPVEMVDGAEPETIVTALQTVAAGRNRVITPFRVNGDDPDNAAGGDSLCHMNGNNHSDISTGKPEEQLLQLLAGQGEQLAALCGTLGQTVMRYRTGDEERAGKSFVELLAGLDQFVRVTSIIAVALQIDFADTYYHEGSLKKRIDDLNAILMLILASQEKRDWVLLADILEYDLLSHLECWLEIYTILRQQVGVAPGSGIC